MTWIFLVINYINDKPPVSLSIPFILYRDSFRILMVRTWIGFIALLPVVLIRFNMDKQYYLMSRIVNRFLIDSTLCMWVMISTLRMITSVSVKWRTNTESQLENLGIWKIWCAIIALVGLLQVNVYLKVNEKVFQF